MSSKKAWFSKQLQWKNWRSWDMDTISTRTTSHHRKETKIIRALQKIRPTVLRASARVLQNRRNTAKCKQVTPNIQSPNNLWIWDRSKTFSASLVPSPVMLCSATASAEIAGMDVVIIMMVMVLGPVMAMTVATTTAGIKTIMTAAT